MAYTVFLSHSDFDAQWAQWLAANAGAMAGVQVYLFEQDTQPGTSVTAKVQQAIRAVNAVIVLLTNNSQESAYVHQEIGFA